MVPQDTTQEDGTVKTADKARSVVSSWDDRQALPEHRVPPPNEEVQPNWPGPMHNPDVLPAPKEAPGTDDDTDNTDNTDNTDSNTGLYD